LSAAQAPNAEARALPQAEISAPPKKRGRPRKKETKFARWIDAHRGGQRDQVAAALAVAPTHLAAILRGDYWPSRELALAIRDLTGGQLSLEDLLDPAKVFG
jgi:hypothetical protein